MAQSGYTPILIYASGTATNVPLAANMTSSASGAELALNYTDGKLYYKDNAGVVKLLASNATSAPVLTFSAGTTGFTPSSATSGAVTLAGTLITSNGGTGLSSYTAGDLSYYASGTALTKLAIGTAGQILTSSGTAPQWSTLSGVAVTTLSFGTTGLTPSTATSGAITVAGTLVVSNGGTGLTSLTAGYIPFGAGTSAFGNSANLFWDNTNARFGIGTNSPSVKLDLSGGNVNFSNTTQLTQLISSSTTAGNQPTLSFQHAGNNTFSLKGGSDLQFYSDGTTNLRATLTNAGNLLIGTAANNYSASIITADPITTTWSGTIALRYNVSGQTNAYYKGMTGLSLIDGQARGLHIFNYDQDSNVGINFYPNNYAGQTATAAVTIASTGVLTSGYGQIAVTGTGSRGVRLTGQGSGEVSAAGDGSTYVLSHNFYNTTSYATMMGGMFAYTAGGAFQYIAIGPTYNSTSSIYVLANGNVGVGMGQPATKLDVNGTLRLTPNTADTNYSADVFANYDSGHPFQINVKNNGSTFEALGVYADGGGSNNRLCCPSFPFAVGATSLAAGRFYVNNTANDTNVRFDTTFNNFTSVNVFSVLFGTNTNSTSCSHFNGYADGANRILIFGNGNIQNQNNSYAGISDIKLKENIVDTTPKLDKLNQVRVVNYNLKDNPEQKLLGVVAQELEQIFPGMVEETPDRDAEGNDLGTVTKSVKYSVFVPMLIKAMQEQQKMIDQLKAEVASLKGA